jgi:hypothetical protein
MAERDIFLLTMQTVPWLASVDGQHFEERHLQVRSKAVSPQIGRPNLSPLLCGEEGWLISFSANWSGVSLAV